MRAARDRRKNLLYRIGDAVLRAGWPIADGTAISRGVGARVGLFHCLGNLFIPVHAWGWGREARWRDVREGRTRGRG